MRVRATAWAGAAGLLGAPVVLAFRSGGYFTDPRLVAGLVVWALVLLLAVAGPAPLPRRPAGAVAAGGLALMTAWSALSLTWAPLAGPAVANVQRLLLYLGALLLAVAVARAPGPRRAIEPALAAGATAVIGYGLSERVLPGLVTLDRSARASGRLEQPITYWNAEGALAAMGLVLCARLAGDRSRPKAVRALAAAAAAPLGAGVYLSFSRGAIAAALAGLVVLVALAPERAQLRAAGAALGTGVLAALASGLMRGPSALAGDLATREREGAVLLAALLLLGAVAAALALRAARRDRSEAGAALPGTGRLAPAAGAVVVLAAAALVAGGLAEKPSRADLAAANAGRLVSISSNRYDYWRVGARAFADHPLQGLGSGGFRVRWLKERTIREGVLEVHSLPLEMAAELGLVGLLSLLLLAGGVAAAARGALRRHGAVAAGPAAAALVFLLHASIDWDWQLPAVSLPALALAGMLVALSESGTELARGPDPATVQDEP